MVLWQLDRVGHDEQESKAQEAEGERRASGAARSILKIRWKSEWASLQSTHHTTHIA